MDSHPSGGFPVSDLGFLSTVNDIEFTVQISRFVLRFSRAFQQIFISQSAFVDPVARPPRLSARDGGQARPSNLRSLRSVPHRTASGIYDKRVPGFTVSRQQLKLPAASYGECTRYSIFMKYPGLAEEPCFAIFGATKVSLSLVVTGRLTGLRSRGNNYIDSPINSTPHFSFIGCQRSF